MPDRIRLSRFVSIGLAPPGTAELDSIQRHGFRAVLDLRDRQDRPDLLSPDTESAAAAARGLAYAWLPIPATQPTDDLLDQFGAVLKRLPKPVFVHGTEDRRAGMFALTLVALEQAVPGRTMLDMARRLGVLYGDQHIQSCFAGYVDRRSQQSDPSIRRNTVLHRHDRPAPLVHPPHDAPEPYRPASPQHPSLSIQHRDRAASRQMVNAVALAVVGTACGMVLDRRFLVIPLLAFGFLAARPMLPRAEALLQAEVSSSPPAVSQQEIEALSRRLHDLQSA